MRKLLMQKLLVLFLAFFACPLAHASQAQAKVKAEAEQKQNVATTENTQQVSHETIEEQETRRLMEQARRRMKIEQQKHKAAAEALIKRINAKEVVPVAPPHAWDLGEANGWRARAFIAAYFMFPIVLAFTHGILNNMFARYAGCGLKRWNSYQAPLREWMTGGIFRSLQWIWAESVFHAAGVAGQPAVDRWTNKILWHAFLIQPIIGLFQEFGETVPLPIWGKGWRSRTAFETSLNANFFESNLSLQIGQAVWTLVGKVILLMKYPAEARKITWWPIWAWEDFRITSQPV